jgi:predicted dehydrogenase
LPPATISVGIIGLGPAWDWRYLPALQNLRRRIRVRAVYDTVLSRAESAAEDLDADVCMGLLSLLERPDVRGVLLLDLSWQGWMPLHFACSRKKPAYVAGSLGEDAAGLRQLYESACAASLTLMPEFSRRYTPATGRLQELLATRLGRPRRIEIEATLPRPDDAGTVPGQGPGRDFLIGLIDWCRHVQRARPTLVTTEEAALEPGRKERRVAIAFAEPRFGGGASSAELRLAEPPAASLEGDPIAGPRFRVECEQGWALIESPTEIKWSLGGTGTTESLAAERTEVEVMLDHFCRRVAGGLIPVADVADVRHSIAVVEAAEQSLRERRTVTLNGQLL